MLIEHQHLKHLLTSTGLSMSHAVNIVQAMLLIYQFHRHT